MMMYNNGHAPQYLKLECDAQFSTDSTIRNSKLYSVIVRIRKLIVYTYVLEYTLA